MSQCRSASFFGMVAAAVVWPTAGIAQGADVSRGWEVAQQECSRCHIVASSPIGAATGQNSLDQLVLRANWPQIPMRSWLTVVHQPRIPAVSRNETDLNDLQRYINVLRDVSVPEDDLVIVGGGPREPESRSIEGEDPFELQMRQPTVDLDLSDPPLDVPIEGSECANCGPPSDKPLNLP